MDQIRRKHLREGTKRSNKCVKLFIKLHQTGEFDEKFDAFELIIKHDFFRKIKKEKNRV